MKTRYKILIIIAITLSVQGGLYLGITSCPSISECQIFSDFYQYVGVSIVSEICSVSEIQNDPNCNENRPTWIMWNNEGIFLFFFVFVPISIIVIIWYRDRK